MAQALADAFKPDERHRRLGRYAKRYCPVGEVFERGRDRNAARATLGNSLAVSAFPLYVPV